MHSIWNTEEIIWLLIIPNRKSIFDLVCSKFRKLKIKFNYYFLKNNSEISFHFRLPNQYHINDCNTFVMSFLNQHCVINNMSGTCWWIQ